MMAVLIMVVMRAHVGTNLGLLHVLWAMVSGRLLPSRGALLPALQSIGLSDEEVRHAWQASCHGAWDINELIGGHVSWVKHNSDWQARRHGGYRVVAGDMVGFFRPKLVGCETKHIHPIAGYALPAIELGMIAEIGHIGQQRVPILTQIVRMPAGHVDHKSLRAAVIHELRTHQRDDEVSVADAEFGPAEMLRAGSGLFVVRGDKNATYRRANPPPYSGRGRRPTRRQVVRPLLRKHKDHEIPADLPDRQESWQLDDGRTISVNIWSNVFLPDSVLADDETADSPMAKRLLTTALTVLLVFHPNFDKPMLLITNMNQTPVPTLCAIYPDRWPIEMIPLSAKHMIGAHRQFVFAPEHTQRLPELALLAGNILSCVAATAQPVATGFWDHLPKATPGRLRRVLSKVAFPRYVTLPDQLRKKNSVFQHLPRGYHPKLALLEGFTGE